MVYLHVNMPTYVPTYMPTYMPTHMPTHMSTHLSQSHVYAQFLHTCLKHLSPQNVHLHVRIYANKHVRTCVCTHVYTVHTLVERFDQSSLLRVVHAEQTIIHMSVRNSMRLSYACLHAG